MKKQVFEAAQNLKTPFYIYDTDGLSDTVGALRKHLPKTSEVCYAIKANPFLIKAMMPLVDRFEICSFGEYLIAKECGVPTEKMFISGVIKKPDETKRIFDENEVLPVFTAESKNQYELLKTLAHETKRTVLIYPRLTSGNKFGMEKDVIDEIASNGKDPFVKITGIHFFPGTQKNDFKKMAEELSTVAVFAKELKEKYGAPIERIEYGPGLFISYFVHDKRQGITDDEWEIFENAVSEASEIFPVTIELGRFLAAETGYYVTEVMDEKSNEGVNYLLTDGGIHQLQYDGQIGGMSIPHIAQVPERDGEEKKWSISGILCTINDVMVRNVPLFDIRVGDRLIFQKTGAYSADEGMALFLSHELPAVYILSDNEIHIAREMRETTEFHMQSEEDFKT